MSTVHAKRVLTAMYRDILKILHRSRSEYVKRSLLVGSRPYEQLQKHQELKKGKRPIAAVGQLKTNKEPDSPQPSYVS